MGQALAQVRIRNSDAPVAQFGSDGQARGGVLATITGTATHRRGLAGQFLIAVVGMLVAQSVGGADHALLCTLQRLPRRQIARLGATASAP